MKYDVIVVGGGPAGAITARDCARLGLKTVILEKEQMPRCKPCAGGVTSAAAGLLDIPIPEDIIEASCTSLRSFYELKSMAVHTKEEFMVVVSRDSFDFWLVNQALKSGADLKQGAKVTSFDIDASGVTVRTEAAIYSGKLLVGADGVNSIISKKVRGPFKKSELAFCVCADIPAGDQNVHATREIEIHYGPLPMSYSWVFPKRNSLSVGVGGWISEISSIKDTLSHFMNKIGIKNREIKGHSIPLGGYRRPAAGERIILVGDAAGYADPFTGEGIRYAIASGRLAAAAISSLIKNDSSLSRQSLMLYERNCYHSFGADLGAALMIARCFRSFPGVLFGIYFNSIEPFQKSLEILQGRIGYRQYYRWLLRQLPGIFLSQASQVKTRA
ncbi:MAG: geranylgeranyl reductase family protein [Desulfotomaculaceae bacterium]